MPSVACKEYTKWLAKSILLRVQTTRKGSGQGVWDKWDTPDERTREQSMSHHYRRVSACANAKYIKLKSYVHNKDYI